MLSPCVANDMPSKVSTLILVEFFYSDFSQMKTSRPSYQDNMLAFHFSTTDMIHVSYHVQITLTLHELQIFLTSRETAGRSALDEVLISIRQTGKHQETSGKHKDRLDNNRTKDWTRDATRT